MNVSNRHRRMKHLNGTFLMAFVQVEYTVCKYIHCDTYILTLKSFAKDDKFE